MISSNVKTKNTIDIFVNFILYNALYTRYMDDDRRISIKRA